MIQLRTRTYATLFAAAVTGMLGTAQSQTTQPRPGDSLKTIHNPGGGEVIYGSLTGQSSPADAMVFMLHQVHGHFGDKPQVSNFFQSRDGSSLATFFTLTAKNQGGKLLAGLVIISMPHGATPQAAVMSDEAHRFVSTEPAMLRALATAQQSSGPSYAVESGSDLPGQPASTPEGGSGPNVPLHEMTAGDGSAYLSVPAGWHLTQVAGGSVTAEGPHHEMVGISLLFQGILDPRNPQSRSPIYQGIQGSGAHLVCPVSSNLFGAYESILNQLRRSKGLPPASFQLISKTQIEEQAVIPPVEAIYTVDLKDGVGLRRASARFDAAVTPGAPTWGLFVSGSNIPIQYADAENATMLAVLHSYRKNGQIVRSEQRAVMTRIQGDIRRGEIQAKAIEERRDGSFRAYEQHRQDLNNHSSTFDQHRGDLDWSSKVTQNYILDRSVVKDNEWDEHGTVGNRLADSLVKANPDRFEIVPNQDMLRGRDF